MTHQASFHFEQCVGSFIIPEGRKLCITLGTSGSVSWCAQNNSGGSLTVYYASLIESPLSFSTSSPMAHNIAFSQFCNLTQALLFIAVLSSLFDLFHLIRWKEHTYHLQLQEWRKALLQVDKPTGKTRHCLTTEQNSVTLIHLKQVNPPQSGSMLGQQLGRIQH